MKNLLVLSILSLAFIGSLNAAAIEDPETSPEVAELAEEYQTKYYDKMATPKYKESDSQYEQRIKEANEYKKLYEELTGEELITVRPKRYRPLAFEPKK